MSLVIEWEQAVIAKHRACCCLDLRISPFYALGPCAWEGDKGSPGKEFGLTVISNVEWLVPGKAECLALGVTLSAP